MTMTATMTRLSPQGNRVRMLQARYNTAENMPQRFSKFHHSSPEAPCYNFDWQHLAPQPESCVKTLQDFEDGGREADAAHETEDVERLTDVEDTLNYNFEIGQQAWVQRKDKCWYLGAFAPRWTVSYIIASASGWHFTTVSWNLSPLDGKLKPDTPHIRNLLLKANVQLTAGQPGAGFYLDQS